MPLPDVGNLWKQQVWRKYTEFTPGCVKSEISIRYPSRNVK